MGWDEATARGRGERLQEALAERPYLADLATLERLEQEEGKRVLFSSQEFPQNAAGRRGAAAWVQSWAPSG